MGAKRCPNVHSDIVGLLSSDDALKPGIVAAPIANLNGEPIVSADVPIFEPHRTLSVLYEHHPLNGDGIINSGRLGGSQLLPAAYALADFPEEGDTDAETGATAIDTDTDEHSQHRGTAVETDERGMPIVFKQILTRQVFLVYALSLRACNILENMCHLRDHYPCEHYPREHVSS